MACQTSLGCFHASRMLELEKPASRPFSSSLLLQPAALHASCPRRKQCQSGKLRVGPSLNCALLRSSGLCSNASFPAAGQRCKRRVAARLCRRLVVSCAQQAGKPRQPNPPSAASVEEAQLLNINLKPTHRSGYVAVVGKPNAGKSTLLNQLVGQKLSIVTPKAQTTRHQILGILSEPDYQMILFDTPGVIPSRRNKLEELMMKNVRSSMISADAVLAVVDITQEPVTVLAALEESRDATSEKPALPASRPLLLVLNKKDMLKPGEVRKKEEWYREHGGADDVVSVSARLGHGVDLVRKWSLSKLPKGPAYYPKDIVSEHPERFFIGEIVREKIFLQYRQEIPYSCQVNVVNYTTNRGRKDHIVLEVVVEKPGQQAIVIGKGGLALKALASAARQDVEDFLQRPVFMEIKVVVQENWRENQRLLQRFGFAEGS